MIEADPLFPHGVLGLLPSVCQRLSPY